MCCVVDAWGLFSSSSSLIVYKWTPLLLDSTIFCVRNYRQGHDFYEKSQTWQFKQKKRVTCGQKCVPYNGKSIMLSLVKGDPLCPWMRLLQAHAVSISRHLVIATWFWCAGDTDVQLLLWLHHLQSLWAHPSPPLGLSGTEFFSLLSRFQASWHPDKRN